MAHLGSSRTGQKFDFQGKLVKACDLLDPALLLRGPRAVADPLPGMHSWPPDRLPEPWAEKGLMIIGVYAESVLPGDSTSEITPPW